MPVGRLILTALLLCPAVGCGDQNIYPVSGEVVDPDGKPIPLLKGARIEFESLEAKKSASGTIDEQGHFRMTTEKTNDGAWLGKHRVLIGRPYVGADKQAPRSIFDKYESFDASGLEVTVEPKDNHVKLTVERLKGG